MNYTKQLRYFAIFTKNIWKIFNILGKYRNNRKLYKDSRIGKVARFAGSGILRSKKVILVVVAQPFSSPVVFSDDNSFSTDNKALSRIITNPQDGQEISSTATDASDVDFVNFFVDSSLLYTGRTVPFIRIWNTNIPRAKAEIKELKKIPRVYTLGINNSVGFDGHGTGVQLPTEEEWDKLAGRMTIVDSVRLSETRSRALARMDHSANSWFPSISNQNEEDLCTCFVQEGRI